MKDKRTQVLEEFFGDLDRMGVGLPVAWYEEHKRQEAIEKEKIAELGKTLKTCLYCEGEPMMKERWNHEYPAGTYIQCENCGMRTPQFIEFIPIDMQRRQYSLLKSVEKAVSLWNKRKEK